MPRELLFVDGPPATEGDIVLVLVLLAMVSLFFSCHMFSARAVIGYGAQLVLFVVSISVAYAFWSAEGTNWTWSGWYWWEWAVFVMLAMCNVSGTFTALPAFGAFVKRVVDPWSYKPWEEDANKTPSLAILLPCYMPNEEGLIEETITHILKKLRYPANFTLVVCYNTPRHLPIEDKLQAMDGSQWAGACGATNTLRVVKVEGSTSKAHNLNHALTMIDTDHVAIYDADHHPDPDSVGILTTYMIENGCQCVQGSTYLRGKLTFIDTLINAEFFVTHFVVFPAQQEVTNTGFFGGSNALWATSVLKAQPFRTDVQTEDIDYSARVLAGGQHQIRFCPDARSGELPPASLGALWNQRLRWLIGWDQTTLTYHKRIKAGLHPCRQLGLFYIFPARWIIMILSLATIYAVPILIFLDIPSSSTFLAVGSITISGPRSMNDLPWINHEAALLLRYQWNCFMIVLAVVFLDSVMFEWRNGPGRVIVPVLFVLLGQLYMLATFCLSMASIIKVLTRNDGGWVITVRATGERSLKSLVCCAGLNSSKRDRADVVGALHQQHAPAPEASEASGLVPDVFRERGSNGKLVPSASGMLLSRMGVTMGVWTRRPSHQASLDSAAGALL